MTNLLVFAIVVSHSCITPTRIQEDYAATSISSDKVSDSTQPVSQPHGATPSHKSTVQTGLTTLSKDASSDELTYKAHLALARAFVKAKEKAKAIESYENAILAALNGKCREAAIEELNSLIARPWKKWFSDSFTLFLQKIQSNWIWIVLVLLFLPLYFLLRRIIRWLFTHKKYYRLLITPMKNSEYTTYFCDLIRYAHDSFEEQRELIRQISHVSSMTIAPTFQSVNLIAELPFNLPDVLASKWWSTFVNPIVNLVDPPNYILHLGVLYAEKQYGLTIRLCIKNKFLAHWYKSCDNVEIHSALRELAYKVVANINQQERKNRYDT